MDNLYTLFYTGQRNPYGMGAWDSNKGRKLKHSSSQPSFYNNKTLPPILSEQMKNYDVDTENSKEENTDSEKELINDIEPDRKKDENTVKQVLNQNNNKNNCNITQIKNTINTDKVTNDLQNIDIKEKERPKIIKFDGRDFIYYPRINKYNDKRKIKKVIYKCKNLRKD